MTDQIKNGSTDLKETILPEVQQYFKELFEETTLQEVYYTPEKLASDLYALNSKVYNRYDLETILLTHYRHDPEKGYVILRSEFINN